MYRSKEALFSLTQGYTLVNGFPKSGLERLKGLSQSGIINWWNKAKEEHLVEYGVYLKNGVAEKDKTGQNMESGAFAVIFLIIPAGTVVASAIFLIEKGWSLWGGMNHYLFQICF